jgi:hypothetical protein
MKTKSLLAKRLVVLAMAVGFLATFVPQASALEPCCTPTSKPTSYRSTARLLAAIL